MTYANSDGPDHMCSLIRTFFVRRYKFSPPFSRKVPSTFFVICINFTFSIRETLTKYQHPQL